MAAANEDADCLASTPAELRLSSAENKPHPKSSSECLLRYARKLTL